MPAITSFEAGDLSAWSGDTGAFSLISSPTTDGSSALQFTGSSWSTISSTSGLNSYPQIGDVVQLDIIFQTSNDAVIFNCFSDSGGTSVSPGTLYSNDRDFLIESTNPEIRLTEQKRSVYSLPTDGTVTTMEIAYLPGPQLRVRWLRPDGSVHSGLGTGVVSQPGGGIGLKCNGGQPIIDNIRTVARPVTPYVEGMGDAALQSFNEAVAGYYGSYKPGSDFRGDGWPGLDAAATATTKANDYSAYVENSYYWDTHTWLWPLLREDKWAADGIGAFEFESWFIDQLSRRPNTINPDGTYRNNRSQPPFYVKTAWEVFRQTDDDALLNTGYETAKTELSWWRSNRFNATYGLFQYGAELESGMDDSERWAVESADGRNMLHPELNALHYYNYRRLADMGEILNNRGYSKPQSDIDDFRAKASALKTAMFDHLWDDVDQWFYDFDTSTGNQSPVVAFPLGGFALLHPDLLSREQRDAVLDRLRTTFFDGNVSPPHTDQQYKTSVGGLWNYNESWPPTKAIVFEGLREQLRAGYLDFQTYLSSIDGESEWVEFDTGSGGGSFDFAWGRETVISPMLRYLHGVGYDAVDGRIDVLPLDGIQDGVSVSWEPYQQSEMSVSFDSSASSVSATIDASGTHDVRLLLHPDLTTELDGWTPQRDGSRLAADSVSYYRVDDGTPKAALIEESAVDFSGGPVSWSLQDSGERGVIRAGSDGVLFSGNRGARQS